MANAFDIWIIQADTVYRGVPYGVATGWVEQGRIGRSDRVRPANVESEWTRVEDHPLLADFLPTELPTSQPIVPSHSQDTSSTPPPTTLNADFEPADTEFTWRKEDDDDEVDMIPLIDISLVLLIYFMMTATVSSLSPVAVPQMKHAAELRSDPEAVTVVIDKRATGEVIFSIRQGERPPEPDDNNLPTVTAVLSRLRTRLSTSATPPEVRIACDETLPRSHVREVAKELDRLRKEKRIAFYGAEVGEEK